MGSIIATTIKPAVPASSSPTTPCNRLSVRSVRRYNRVVFLRRSKPTPRFRPTYNRPSPISERPLAAAPAPQRPAAPAPSTSLPKSSLTSLASRPLASLDFARYSFFLEENDAHSVVTRSGIFQRSSSLPVTRRHTFAGPWPSLAPNLFESNSFQNGRENSHNRTPSISSAAR